MKIFLFLLFIIGIVLTILGWFFDKIEYYPRFIRLISTDYVNGIDALDALKVDVKRAVTRNHPGF